MKRISENEFARICNGIIEDRASILKHNPIGSDREVLLWMLLNCMNSYLSLSELEMPCFTGVPDENTYRDAIMYVLRDRMEPAFEPLPYVEALV